MEASAIWYKTPSIVSELVLHYVRLASWHELFVTLVRTIRQGLYMPCNKVSFKVTFKIVVLRVRLM
uniref:Uncharacterized protein n=1 Tax=Solanum tuberosum TaxID=4113 RepID=M1B7P4_SOLTU